MHLTSSQDYRKIDSLIKRGPRVIMLVYSTTCPHCVTYMPIWKKLCKEKGKTAHMVSMEHSVYSETPMAAKKPVSGVPTVLFVDPQGGIHEEDNIRDETVMKKAMTESSPMSSEETSEPEEVEESEETEATEATEATEEMEEPMLRTSDVSDEITEASVFRPAKNRTATPYPDSIRGTTEVEDTLPALPATPIRTLTMTGGSYGGSYTG
jgi:thiol-disulfide isomerase/thioredoxin